nr:hypothetical protein B0A51_12201 [Rachicladosporium sp. CCFEE 5018]
MSTNGVLSMAGWYFLPGLVTGYLQSILYTIFIRAGDPKPAPGSPRFVKDRRRVHIFVVLFYLAYTVYEADWQLRKESDFYQALGVAHDASEKAIQSRFRRLTVQFHPDKVNDIDKERVEAIYVRLQVAKDTLVDPIKRFAYDRFGPEMLAWTHCKTLSDFVFHGVKNITTYYFSTAVGLLLLGVLGYMQSGKFWRYMVMATLFVVELHAMTRPTFPPILTRLVNPLLLMTGLRPPYLPFQMLALLRKLAVTFFIAMSQLAPLLRDPASAAPASDTVTPQDLDRIDALAKAADQETGRLLGLELAPFAGDEYSIKSLKAALKDWLVQNTVRNDPEVRAAMGQVFEGRRAAA